ncbi:MAG: hypothetical protein C0596_16740 [Marinilabiliales bacterium]|nr:MAG: hypothetical protein C0596_16740 [Marinilabiliales bacterium]
MFLDGMDIPQIAKSRGFVESTIYGHLAHYAAIGELDYTVLISDDKFEEIKSIIELSGSASLNEIMTQTDRKLSYNEIKLVLSCLKSTTP